MATTRDFESLGEFAVNATEVGETGGREDGESYRNTDLTTFQQNRGKQFNVVPASQNANQQIYNQSQFTNLADYQGIPGWKDSVVYAKSAMVFGSDGTLYLGRRDNNINVDPAEDDYAVDWWEVFEGGAEIASKFASQIPDQEGSRLVGNTTKVYDPNRTNHIPFQEGFIGKTVKDSLDTYTRLFEQMQNVEILVALDWLVSIDSDYPSSIPSSWTENYNIATIDITAYSKEAPQAFPGYTHLRIGYLTVNFAKPIPTPYLYLVTVSAGSGLQGFFIGNTHHLVPDLSGRPFYGVNSTSVANLTSTSIDIGNSVLSRKPDSFSAQWPASWDNENPMTRLSWNINLFCYRLI